MKITSSVFKANHTSNYSENPSTLICFSHLRWDFVYQRPQHLLSRFSKRYLVYYVEEPFFTEQSKSTLVPTKKEENLWVLQPHLTEGMSEQRVEQELKGLLNEFLQDRKLDDCIFWYYTPMALPFTAHHKPALTVYDCMDELSNFNFAPPRLSQLENEMFQKADIVFTGGQSLYEHKKSRHSNIYPFPSSIDKRHFGKARRKQEEPGDQKKIEGIKIGFYGVIDERFDIELVRAIALKRPEWNIVLLGPTAKIDPLSIPQLPNVFMLGGKTYDQLPQYLSAWDVALIPFAINSSTRFISPTKTPEYLAAGVPVISTAIRDVVTPYGDKNIVSIAHTADEFIAAAEQYMKMKKKSWLKKADEFLANKSWNATFVEMLQKMEATLKNLQENKPLVPLVASPASTSLSKAVRTAG